MRKKRTTSRSAKLNWETENLRLTAFPRFPERADECNAWEGMFGRKPNTRQERPHDRAIVEAGEFENGWLTLEISPTRIDWRLTMKVDQDSPPSGLPIFGSFREARDAFVVLMKRWLKTTSPLNRLAFGAALLMPVSDRKTGYRTLDQLLPSVQLDPEGMSDFYYRVNRRRPSGSGIKGLKINRLSTWSVTSLETMQLQIAPGSSRVLETGQLITACRLELDVNTVPEYTGRLAKRALPRLFQEFVDLATEISENGDQP